MKISITTILIILTTLAYGQKRDTAKYKFTDTTDICVSTGHWHCLNIDSLNRVIAKKDSDLKFDDKFIHGVCNLLKCTINDYYQQFMAQDDTILYLRVKLGQMKAKSNNATIPPHPKWKETGWSQYKEGVTKEYTLVGKDSVSVSLAVGDCNCTVYTELGEHGKRSCKGLKRYYLETKYWNIVYSVTTVNGVVIARDKPHWETSMGESSTTQGVYLLNGKQVYPVAMWTKGKETKIDY